jgi:hypothetical protein
VLSIQILIVHLFSSKRHDLFWWFSTRIIASFRVIYTDDLLDTKIKKPFGYRGKDDYTIYRDLPTSDFPSEIIKSEKTSSAEALRLIRTNLEFMLTKVSDGIAKTIFVTSTFLTKERLLFRQILQRLSHCQQKKYCW